MPDPVTGVMAGTSLVGAGMASSASKKAARQQAASTDAALAQQNAQYEKSRKDLAPWRESGGAANTRLSELLGLGEFSNESADDYGSLLKNFDLQDFETSPGYQFRLAEGNKGMDRASASRGSFDSGATLKALTRFNQDYASNEYGNAYNRDASNKDRTYNYLSGVSGTGANTAGMIAGLGANNANANSQLITGAGNARAAGTVGAANAWQTGLGNISGAARDYNTLNMLTRNQPNSTTEKTGFNASPSMYGVCWVAREVYGEDNPKWLQFREYLLNDAPKWFMNLYIKYGERFALWIHDKSRLKDSIRGAMNLILRGHSYGH